MRVLLDECLPRKLKLEIKDHFARTVPEAGWAGKLNGELLRLAEKDFDVFLTIDGNIEHQQNLAQFDLAFIILLAPTNDIDDLRPMMPDVTDLLTTIMSGEVRYVRA